MTDFAMQRLNMVESQLRPSDITDRRILRAMADIPREAYLPGPLKSLAYMDEDIRVPAGTKGQGRTMLAPRTLALLIQLARVEPNERVLEIGSGTGYATAVLARLTGQVTAVECDAELAKTAQATLSSAGIANAKVIAGALAEGHPADAPYDAILLNGALVTPPAALLDQLRDGGRLVAIEMREGFGRAAVWMRHAMSYDKRTAFDAGAAILPGFEAQPAFSL
jgi:protein-L-isoaspartate(D-aspartate) O-methyltransferase